MKHRILRQIGPFLEIFGAIRANIHRPGYAWRILTRGVCDGCALGTTGLKDWTMDQTHLCWIRLNLLGLNTMRAFDPAILNDDSLARKSEKELRALGRLPAPLLRRKGESRFRAIDWDAAMELMQAKVAAVPPERLAFYLVSRGTANETYYAAQKAARALGTNHVDNSARVCHAPSTTALKRSVGFAATTCSYSDLLKSDLVVLFGSDVANNQPVMMKYLHMAKKRGTKVAIVNPVREPGMERYWVPSNFDSALLGTRVTDEFFTIQVGGDIAFIHGVLKILIERGWTDAEFIARHTADWDELETHLGAQSIEELEELSGATRADFERFARMYHEASSAISIWSMGITMHRHGVANVQSIANLALARGMIGKPGSGLMAIRGHSGVQGGAEMGCVPNQLPGGGSFSAEGLAKLETDWGFAPPREPGYFAAEMIDAAHRGELDVLYSVGGNLPGILPDPDYVREALARVPLRVHHDIVLNPQMFVEAAEAVLVLPATTRYEMSGGNTETSTERRVIFNPEISGPRVPGARDEWRVLSELARRVRPERAAALAWSTTAEIREEIARVIPMYDGIQNLRAQGDQFQWGGAMLGSDARFGFPDGRARFTRVEPPRRKDTGPGRYRLSTRRGKQFNSMVFGDRDMLTGHGRDRVVLAPEELERLSLRPGDAVVVRSAAGELRGHVAAGPIQKDAAMLYWPEANVLIPRGVLDPECGIPAYRDTLVEVLPAAQVADGTIAP